VFPLAILVDPEECEFVAVGCDPVHCAVRIGSLFVPDEGSFQRLERPEIYFSEEPSFLTSTIVRLIAFEIVLSPYHRVKSQIPYTLLRGGL
jgi:hypothetical protein